MHIDSRLNAISIHTFTKPQHYTLSFVGLSSQINMGITMILTRFWNFPKIFTTNSTERLYQIKCIGKWTSTFNLWGITVKHFHQTCFLGVDKVMRARFNVTQAFDGHQWSLKTRRNWNKMLLPLCFGPSNVNIL